MKIRTLPQRKKKSDYEMIEEIRSINSELDEAYRFFQNQTDEDLLEASIYKINELRARHSYLIKQARKNNISAVYMKFDGEKQIKDA